MTAGNTHPLIEAEIGLNDLRGRRVCEQTLSKDHFLHADSSLFYIVLAIIFMLLPKIYEDTISISHGTIITEKASNKVQILSTEIVFF